MLHKEKLASQGIGCFPKEGSKKRTGGAPLSSSQKELVKREPKGPCWIGATPLIPVGLVGNW